MALTEKRMRVLEEQIPELAVLAIKQAYCRALASGSSVLMSENDTLVEIFPDGTRKFIKKLGASTKVTPGTKWEIR